MTAAPPYKISLLSDSAVILEFGNTISENIHREVLALFSELQRAPLPGMIEAVPSYSSLAVYYDIFLLRKQLPHDMIVSDWMMTQLEESMRKVQSVEEPATPVIRIPACYEKEFAPDLARVALAKNIPPEEVIALHEAGIYRVYLLGFLPGFAYMGEVDERIAVPRKSVPEPVKAGDIGIAGRQTGIYPMISPGGWQIVGRTPMKLFEAHGEPLTLLKSGDRVQFYSISSHEFKNY